jgi:type II secretory pathway component GspD/PulD (secretin)
MVQGRHSRLRCLSARALALSLVLSGPAYSQTQDSGQSLSSEPTPVASLPAVKPDPKKAAEAYKQGVKAEQATEWPAAYEEYSNAVNWAPDNRDYFVKRELAKSRLVQEKMDLAERDAVSGRLPEARRELLAARYLDPTNTVVRDRLVELTALEPSLREKKPVRLELAGPVRLEHLPGKKSFNYRGNTQGAYDEVARQFGVEAAFDSDLHERPVHLQVDQEDFATTLRILGAMTSTFWKPLAKHLLFVTDDTAQKRKDYNASAVRTVELPAAATPEQMTETLRLVREIAGITRSDLDTRTRTLTMRASPQAIAVAADLIDTLEKPVGEMVLEIEVLDVDRAYAQELGITPPQSGQVFTLSNSEITDIQQNGVQGLLDVIQQIFGTPSSLSGLTSTQIGSLLGSGALGVGSLIPPIVAFGGGKSIFFSTIPGAAANFSEMLNVVRDGRRILLRAEDGKAATFFVGERFPVTLAQFSPSLAGEGANVPGVTGNSFPVTTLTTGNAPDFIATASLRNNSINDLIVANHNDNTLSVFLGNGDGTFGDALTPAPTTGNGPVWIATGVFNGTNNNTAIDLAVANQTDNTVTILLGNGDGTFTPGTTLKTGNGPVSIAATTLTTNGSSSVNNNVCLFVANHTDDTISIFLGNGDGTFVTPTAATTLATGRGPSSILAADFNGDGKIDLAVTNQTDNTVSIFLGNGDGTFGARTDDNVGNGPVWVATGDFNGDGIPDLAIANDGAPTDTNTGDTVTILLGQANTNSTVGNGTFAPGSIRDFPAGDGPTSIAVGDFNVDGIPDLLVADSTDNAISLLLGLGEGVFGPNFELNVGTDPVSIVSADFNGDGIPDAAVANNGSNTASVILDTTTFTGGAANGLTATPFPGVEYLDIGLKVKATPRVHLNDEVSLQLNFENSSLAGTSLNGIPLVENQQVEQTVRVKIGETTMVAGFLQAQRQLDVNGTPVLSDVPVTGLLSSDQNAQNTSTELVILITPRMISLAPRADHEFYAGRGSPEGPGAVSAARSERDQTPRPVPPVQPPVQPPAQPLVQPPVQQQPPPEQQQPPPAEEPPPNNPPQPNPAPEPPPNQ